MNWLEKEIEKCEFFSFIFKNQKKLVLFGGAGAAIELLRYIEKEQIKIEVEYIIDNDKRLHGTCIANNIPVISMEEFAQRNKEDIKILLTTRKAYQVYHELIYAGVKKENIWFPKTSFVVKESFMTINWITGFFMYVRMLDIYLHQKEILNLYNLLEDEWSKKVLEAVIKFRLTQEPKYITEVCRCTNSDYFEDAPFEIGDKETFVDIGALNGDSALEFLNKCNDKFEHIHLFEPDDKALCCAMDSLFTLGNRDKISYYHLAVSKERGLESFCGGVLGVGNTKMVHTMPLDYVLKDKKVTLIKMDIEGAEADALLGAKDLIKMQSPKLCVCIYHKMDDLWRLPLLIKELNPNYRISIRQNSPGVHGDIQTVCYAY